MLNRVPEESRQAPKITVKALNFNELSSLEPLKFQFYYEDNNQAEIINTIYLKDSDQPLKLYLKVFNDSNEVVTFKDPKSVSVGGETASATDCHFHLHFEKDLGLNPHEIEIEPNPDSGQWQVNYDDEPNFFAVYFLHKKGLSLRAHEGITICFLNLTANNRTVKTSNVALLYGGNNLVSKGRNLQNEITSRITISVINHLSKTQIPLQFRVLGSNAILNDGTTKNTLRLKVINSPLSNNERKILSLDQSSKFIVSFEQGEHPDALVATTSQLNNVQIAVTKDTDSWTSTHTPNSTGWSFTPHPELKQWEEGEGIELTINNLVTSGVSGLACIYIDYQNIGSYPDGRLVIPIEKTPLLYSGENVGIGINNPQAKLHVNGGDAVISGKVGIGTTTPTAKLHVNGGNAVISGKVGIGTTNPNINLAIGDNDTGLHLEGYQNLSLMINGKQRVEMPDGEPVVISGGLAVGCDSTPIERILCGRVVVQYTKDLDLMKDMATLSPYMKEIITNERRFSLVLYGNEILSGVRINTGIFEISFKLPFEHDQADRAFVLLTSPDTESTVHLVSISPFFRVITRDAKTQESKDASFNFVIILPTSSEKNFPGVFFN